MTVWPQFSCMRCAITRPSTSTEPPGGYGTMIRTGFSGYLSAGDCACADVPSVQAAASAVTRASLTSWRMLAPARVVDLGEEQVLPRLRRFLQGADAVHE